MPLKRGEKSIEINDGNVVYEILGKTGDFIVLTPGGRFSKDIPGLRPLAQALVKGGYRVLLWDRPNCGRSGMVALRLALRPSARTRRVSSRRAWRPACANSCWGLHSQLY